MIQNLSTLMKAFGEPTRLKIIKLLSQQELCVCELEYILDMSQPRVSQHLRVLKHAGLIKERKERQRSFYSLDLSIIQSGEIQPMIAFMSAPMEAMEDFQTETERLKKMADDIDIKNCKAGLRDRSSLGDAV